MLNLDQLRVKTINPWDIHRNKIEYLYHNITSYKIQFPYLVLQKVSFNYSLKPIELGPTFCKLEFTYHNDS